VTPHSYLLVLTAGSAVTGAWVAARFSRFTPSTARGASAYLIVAFFMPLLAVPAAELSGKFASAGLALFLAVFPAFVVTFAFAAWSLRYLAGLMHQFR